MFRHDYTSPGFLQHLTNLNQLVSGCTLLPNIPAKVRKHVKEPKKKSWNTNSALLEEREGLIGKLD